MKKSVIAVMLLGMMVAHAGAAEFTCELENNKYVSVSVNEGKMPVYKYGTLSNTEITLPTNEKNSKNIFYGYQLFAQGASTYIRFKSGDYSYVVFDGEGKGWYFTGLVVYKGDKIINKKACKDPMALNLYAIKDYGIKEDPQLEQYIYAP